MIITRVCVCVCDENHLAFDCAEGGSTRIVSVPRFSTTGVAVLIDLVTLACEPIAFSGAVTQAAAEDGDDA